MYREARKRTHLAKRLSSVGLAFIAVLCVLLSVGCDAPQVQSPSPSPDRIGTEYEFSTRFTRITGYTPESWLSELSAVEDVPYEDICIAKDGVSVRLVLLPEQVKGWADYFDGRLEALQRDFSAVKDGYRFEICDDYMQLDFYFDRECTDDQLCLGDAMLYCLCRQILENRPDSELYVSVNIIDSDTGRPVKWFDCDMSIRIEPSDWDAE